MSYTSWIEAVKSVGLGEERKPGVWQTDSGNWAGKRPDGSTQYGMKGKEKAQAYVAGKDVEVDEPEAEPEKEKKPKTSDSDGQFGYTGDKDKSLQKVDTSESEFYNEDIKPSDSKYKTPAGFEAGPPPEPFKFPEGISNGKFPKKYGTLIERMMNSKRKGKKPKITSFISGGGAGVISAQAGEVMTMMASSMNDEEWNKTSKMLFSYKTNWIIPIFTLIQNSNLILIKFLPDYFCRFFIKFVLGISLLKGASLNKNNCARLW